MHPFHPQPHISAAVKHLRGWITLLAILVAVCCVGQMLIYGFVRFTEIRFTEVARPPAAPERGRQVVVPPDSDAAADPGVVGGVRSRVIEHGHEVGPVRVLSNANEVMSRLNLFCSSAGALACVMLTVLTLLGTVVAGGGNIPGVERAVTASTWSLVLGLLCVPWASAFPHLRIPGVFASYQSLCAVADDAAGAATPTAALAQWIFMPVGCAVLAMVVLGMFRAGVERGVIATSPSHFDGAIEREMSELARRGISAAGAGRTVGTINRPLGHNGPVMPVIPGGGHAGARGLSVEEALEDAAATAAMITRESQSGGLTRGGEGAPPLRGRRLI